MRENETKIYQSSNPHFSGWVEIVDGQDENVYLYVGEKNNGGGREIKIGIKKSEFEKCSRGSDDTPYKSLEDHWGLFTIDRARTPVEEREYYSKTGGLEQEWERNWPHRQGLCRKYLEKLREQMKKKFDYWQARTKQKKYWDHEANEQGILAHAHMSEIDYCLTDMKKNRPDYYAACDKDCDACGVKLCCHFRGKACSGDKCWTRPDENLLHFCGRIPEPKRDKSSQLTQVEKKQLLQFFLDHNISKISVENGQLKIEYSQKEKQEVNSSDLEKYRHFIQNLPSHSLSLKDLQSQNNSQTDSPNNNKLAIGLALGAGAVILIGIIVYFGRKKVKKNNE